MGLEVLAQLLLIGSLIAFLRSPHSPGKLSRHDVYSLRLDMKSRTSQRFLNCTRPSIRLRTRRSQPTPKPTQLQ